MVSKNTVAYPGVWNLCQLSENDFQIQKDKKSKKDLSAIVRKGSKQPDRLEENKSEILIQSDHHLINNIDDQEEEEKK